MNSIEQSEAEPEPFMTREQLIDFFEDEIVDMIEAHKQKSLRDNGFYKRKAEDLVDTLIGWGILETEITESVRRNK